MNQHLKQVSQVLIPDINDEIINGYFDHAEQSVDNAIKQLSRVKYEIKKMKALNNLKVTS